MTLLIRRADIGLAHNSALRIEGGLIKAVRGDLSRRPGEEVLDAAGGAVLPGFHDHHVHLRALAGARQSVAVGPSEAPTADHLARRLAVVDAGLPDSEWLRAVGYHESIAGELNRWMLDRMVKGRPVRIQHRSGALWILNSAGISAVGADESAPPGAEVDESGRIVGRFWRADRWLASRLPAMALDLAGVAWDAAALGVTGLTEATPDQSDDDLAALAELSETGAIPQRLHLMAPADADLAPAGARVTVGPVKILLDDDNLPAFDDLVRAVAKAHAVQRPVAVHCATRVQGVLAGAAISSGGPVPGDRIEHAAVIGADQIDELLRLGLTVVTQPAMAAERGDQYLAKVEPCDRPDLWRLASLVRAGVQVALGSDAPYGPIDPWRTIAAAVTRATPEGAVLGVTERLTPTTALALYVGHADRPARPRRIAVGQPADLVVLHEPRCVAFRAPFRPSTMATVIDGLIVYRD